MCYYATSSAACACNLKENDIIVDIEKLGESIGHA